MMIIVARHGTKNARHGVVTFMSEARLKEIAVLDGGNRQISAKAALDMPKCCSDDESFNSDRRLQSSIDPHVVKL